MKLILTGESKLCIADLPKDIEKIVEGAQVLNNVMNLRQLREVSLGELPENIDLTEVTPLCDIDTAVDEFSLRDDRTGRHLMSVEVVSKEVAYDNDMDFLGNKVTKEEYEAEGGLGSEFSYYRKFVDGDKYFRIL